MRHLPFLLTVLLIPAAAPAGIRVERATTKVLKTVAGQTGQQSVSLEAARNEWEAFQIVVTASDGALPKVSVEVSDLAGPEGATIPGSAAERFLESYVHIDQPSYCEYILNWDCALYPEYVRTPGDYPDALIPFVDPYGDVHAPVAAPFDVPEGEFRTVFVDLHVPADAKPGEYAGTVTVTSDGKPLAAIPLSLTVWDFAIPAQRNVATSYGFSWGAPLKYHDAPDPVTRERILRNYERECHRHRIDFTNYPAGLSFPVDAGGKLGEIDFSAFDAEMGPRLDGTAFPDGGGVARFNLGMFTPGYGKGGLSPENWAAAAKAVAEHLDGRGWLKHVYLYSADEPWMIGHEGAFEAIRDDVTDLRAASPLWYGHVLATSPWLDTLDGYVDIWCPVTPMYGNDIWPGDSWAGPDKYAEEFAKGHELWFYVCNANFPPTLGYDVDSATGFEPRLVKWQAWHEHATGFLYWSITYWQDPDPWHVLTNVAEFGEVFSRQGDGILIYPGNHTGPVTGGSPPDVALDGPVVSYRLKQIRDGLEDWEVFILAENLGAGEYARAQVERAVRRFGDALLPDFDPADRPWELDEEILLDARRNVSRKVQFLLHPGKYVDPEPKPVPDAGVLPEASGVEEAFAEPESDASQPGEAVSDGSDAVPAVLDDSVSPRPNKDSGCGGWGRDQTLSWLLLLALPLAWRRGARGRR